MVRIVVGVILVLVGGVWFLQGIDVLGGSFMSGEIVWSVIGFPLLFVGALFIRAGAARGSARGDRA
jgi:hypothetical protein